MTPRQRHLYARTAPATHRVSRALGLHHVRNRQRTVVREVTLPTKLGLRLIVLSDIHADPHFMPRHAIDQLVTQINELGDATAVLMPGDFVGHDLAAIEWCADALRKLSCPPFATLGNHDHLLDAGFVTAALRDAGVTVLMNEAVELREDVFLGGLDSMSEGAPDAAGMSADVPDDAMCVVLGHEPKLATMHDHLLHVAGHTHHGQIRLRPFRPLILPRNSRPYVEGLHTIPATSNSDARWVYTTAGVGSTTIPLRVGCPPEIVVLNL